MEHTCQFNRCLCSHCRGSQLAEAQRLELMFARGSARKKRIGVALVLVTQDPEDLLSDQIARVHVRCLRDILSPDTGPRACESKVQMDSGLCERIGCMDIFPMFVQSHLTGMPRPPCIFYDYNNTTEATAWTYEMKLHCCLGWHVCPNISHSRTNKWKINKIINNWKKMWATTWPHDGKQCFVCKSRRISHKQKIKDLTYKNDNSY